MQKECRTHRAQSLVRRRLSHLALCVFSSFFVSFAVAGEFQDSQFVPKEWLAQELTYAQLQKFIDDSGAKSVDALLEKLSADPKYRDLFTSATLVHHSHSAQRADVTPDTPRILGHFGNLLIAMTGKSPKEGGSAAIYNRLEIIEADPDGKRFRFHLIDFNKSGTAKYHTDETSCQRCHGNPPHPIWQTYPNWPGLYGAYDDFIGDLTPKGRDNWKHFVTSHAKQGRYHYFPVERFFESDTDIPGTREQKNNQRFNAIVTNMIPMQWLGILQPEKWGRYRFAMAGAVKGCEDFRRFFPDDVWKKHVARLGGDLDAVTSRINEQIRIRQKAKVDRMVEEGDASLTYSEPTQFDYSTFASEHVQRLARLAFIAEGQSELSVPSPAHWSFDIDPLESKTSYTTTNLGMDLTNGKFRTGFREQFRDSAKSCAALQASSLEALSVAAPAEAARSSRSAAPTHAEAQP